MPSDTVSSTQLLNLSTSCADDLPGRFDKLKKLLLETYCDPLAHVAARKDLTDMKMGEHGVLEYSQHLNAQFEVCQATPKCDETDETVRETFIVGLPQNLPTKLLEMPGAMDMQYSTLVTEATRLATSSRMANRGAKVQEPAFSGRGNLPCQYVPWRSRLGHCRDR